MIATWYELADKTWGARVQGKALKGSIVTVRFKDRREPRVMTVTEVLSCNTIPGHGDISICRVVEGQG